MAGSIQFTIEGLTVRGFHEHMKHWVPNMGQRLECKINDGKISAFIDQQSMGNVPKEWSKFYRKWLNAGGKLEAFVCGLHKGHKNKGEEVPVLYLFSGDGIPLLINTRNRIERETEKVAKKKKSLQFHNEDKTAQLLQTDLGSSLRMVESLESKDKLDFSVMGMSLRGFFEYKKIWVPEINSRHECFISNGGSIAIEAAGDISGNIPTDVQTLWRTFLKEKGKIFAVVAGPPRNHRTKGEEIPVSYIFTGDMTCILQNLRRSIIADIVKKKKKKKSLDVQMGDVTQIIQVKHDITAGPSHAASSKASGISCKASGVSGRAMVSDVTGKRVSVGKVSGKRGLKDKSNDFVTKKLKTSTKKGDISPIPGDGSINLTEKDFSKLSQILGENWKHLGRQLDLTEVVITHIDMDRNYYSIEEKIYQMLIKWGKQYPENNSLRTIITAINECPKVQKDQKLYDIFIKNKRSVLQNAE